MTLNVVGFSLWSFVRIHRSAPGKGLAHHLKEQLVWLPEVVAELFKGLSAERGMWPAFGLVQALVMSTRQQAVEALSGVVIEIAGANSGWQLQKSLGLPELWEWVSYECITVHHVDLLLGEDLKPAGQVLVVQAPL